MNKVNEDILRKIIFNGIKLDDLQYGADSPDFLSWHSRVARFYEETYGKGSSLHSNFLNRHFSPNISFGNENKEQLFKQYKKHLETTVKELQEILEENTLENGEKSISIKADPVSNKKVFIVHGRDDAKKYELSVFLYENGLQPVILHEQVNKGQTIIEKIEANSDVSCAIILLTPDDLGKLNTSDSTELKTRARQNVIFEAGYFIGRLGRNRVILISDVEETMTDIDGIVYLSFNNYKNDLIKELKEIGIYK